MLAVWFMSVADEEAEMNQEAEVNVPF